MSELSIDDFKQVLLDLYLAQRENNELRTQLFNQEMSRFPEEPDNGEE